MDRLFKVPWFLRQQSLQKKKTTKTKTSATVKKTKLPYEKHMKNNLTPQRQATLSC